ncbi:hypothetical protein [Synechococcus sp. MU1642]|uniref:hypothetical protein n=1 Tax=Synechococcus sp. MU1642 TaxID=2508348 RepID=UPI001CF86430|nr:hypothetical protein [Synechococcus sp. MU1642]
MGGESGSFRAPADLILQPLYPLVTAVREVCPLGEALLVVSASWLSDSFLSEGVLKMLAGQAHHQRMVGS